MTSGAKALVFVLTVAGLGTAGYFVLRPSNQLLRQEIMTFFNNEADRPRLTAVVNQMTRQELLDTLYLLKLPENSRQQIDLARKARLLAISKKYNIFT